MADLKKRVNELYLSLQRQVQVSKKPSDTLGTAQQNMLAQLVDEFLAQQDDPTIRAARGGLGPQDVITVGDAISVLDLMRQRGERSPRESVEIVDDDL